MDNFDNTFFSKSKPNLILNKTIKKWQNGLNQEFTHIGGFNDMLFSFYNNYIEPNLFFIFLLALFILFLTYKYYTKDEFKAQETFKPNFNPTSEIELQDSYTNYLPDQTFSLDFNNNNNTNNNNNYNYIRYLNLDNF